MKEKTLISIWGTANQGKSVTVRRISEIIIDNFPQANTNYLVKGLDITVIIKIGKIKIGIESQGDPGGHLEESLNLFSLTEKCDLILCTSRTSGMTVEAIEKVSHEYSYNIIWATNLRSKTNQDYLNDYSAKTIFKFIETLI